MTYEEGRKERASERASEGTESRRVRTYRDLLVWQRGMELADAVYTLTRAMPAEEKYGLCSQMRRGAVSIPSNIAEEHARQSRADYIRFLRVARGSLAELETQTEIASRQRLVQDDRDVLSLCTQLAMMLQSLIRKLEAKEPGR